MKCLIIAAGQGTRLRAVADSKPLAQIRGAALIEHVVRLAKAGGASEFVVVTGYEAPRVEAFLPALADRHAVSVLAVRNPDWPRPNGLSVVAAAEHLGAEFILLMADHLFEPGIVRLLLDRRIRGSDVTLAVDRQVANPLIDLEDATKVQTAPDRRIVRIGKTIADYDAIDTGIFLATPALVEGIRKDIAAGGAGSLSAGVQALADAGRAYAADIGKSWWADIDDEAAMRRADRSFPLNLVEGM